MPNKPLKVLSSLVLSLLLVACEPPESGLKLGEEFTSEGEEQHTADMIEAIKAMSLERYSEGLIKRFNQSKTLGCFDASFTVAEGLEPRLRQGIFADGRSYPALLRFASASQEDDREKDFHGLSIKLRDVDGEPLWGNYGEQDFLFNSYPALFAATPNEFREFIKASQDKELWRYFLHPAHLHSLGVVFKGRKSIDNPFKIKYWSTTPYRFGEDESTAVKYSVRPCQPTARTDEAREEIVRHRNLLSHAMRRQLHRGSVCFDFMVQFQVDPDRMPIENAAVTWNESESGFVKVAQIRIEKQLLEKDELYGCEATTFNPWQSLTAHRPLGGINRVRGPIYAEIGEFRQRENRLRKIE